MAQKGPEVHTAFHGTGRLYTDSSQELKMTAQPVDQRKDKQCMLALGILPNVRGHLLPLSFQRVPIQRDEYAGDYEAYQTEKKNT